MLGKSSQRLGSDLSLAALSPRSVAALCSRFTSCTTLSIPSAVLWDSLQLFVLVYRLSLHSKRFAVSEGSSQIEPEVQYRLAKPVYERQIVVPFMLLHKTPWAKSTPRTPWVLRNHWQLA